MPAKVVKPGQVGLNRNLDLNLNLNRSEPSQIKITIKIKKAVFSLFIPLGVSP